MSHRGVRVLVWLVALAVVGAAGYALFDLDRRARAERDHSTRFASAAYDLALLVEQLKAAQQSYVAEGQGTDFWRGRAATIVASIEAGLQELGRAARAEQSAQALQAASKELADVRQLDRRAREYIQQGQRLTASDLIFSDSLTAAAALSRRIGYARQEQLAVSDARLVDLRDRQLYLLTGAAALTLFLTVMLVPRPRVPQPPADAREHVAAGEMTATDDLSLRPEAPRARMTTPRTPAPKHSSPPTAPLAVDLAGTATVCADMARVLDPADLPRLLERAAALLHASGVIVWVADRAGTALFPAVAHGYPASLLARMPTIERNDDNAAAAAWRMGEIRTVPATESAPGALVSPIVTSEGCVGVLAAEVRGGAEARDDVRAIATILAAQLATFVTTLPSPQGDA
jgi:hypothetical protein